MLSYLSRRVQVGIVAFVLIVGPTAVYVAPAFDSRLPCQRAQAWTDANQNNLPATAAELAAFPESLRRAIFSKLSPETKATVWKQQLTGFANARPLTVDQRAVVEDIVALITPVNYSSNPSTEREAGRLKIANVVSEARKVIAPQDHVVFFNVGYSVTPRYSFASLRFSAIEALRNYATVGAGAALAPTCECYPPYEEEECGPFSVCNDTVFCDFEVACGPIGTMNCTGMCESAR